MGFWLTWRTWRTSGTTCPQAATTLRPWSNSEAAIEISQWRFLGYRPRDSGTISCGGVGRGHWNRLTKHAQVSWTWSHPWDLGQIDVFTHQCDTICFLILGNEANSIEYETDQGSGPQSVDGMEGQTVRADVCLRIVVNWVLEYGQRLLHYTQLILCIMWPKEKFFWLYSCIKFFLMSEQKVKSCHYCGQWNTIASEYPMFLLIRVPSAYHPVHKHLLHFQAGRSEQWWSKGRNAGPFGAMVPAGALVPSSSSGPGNYILSPDGAMPSSYQHLLPAKQTLGRYLLLDFKVVEKCSSGLERST